MFVLFSKGNVVFFIKYIQYQFNRNIRVNKTRTHTHTHITILGFLKEVSSAHGCIYMIKKIKYCEILYQFEVMVF